MSVATNDSYLASAGLTGYRASLARCFLNNERDGVTSKWTDAKIYSFINSRFASTRNWTFHQVQAERTKFNRRSHEYQRVSTAAPMVYGYDEAGNRVKGSTGLPGDEPNLDATPTPVAATSQTGSVDESAVRSIAHSVVTEREPAIVSAVVSATQSLIPTDEHIREVAASVQAPNITIVLGDKREVTVKSGTYHKKFQTVLNRVRAGIPVLLVGPAGTGKTKLISQVAEALGLSFTMNSMSAGTKESDIFGRTLPDSTGNWSFQPAPFVHTYEKGGLHLFDEIDAADSNLLVSINSAIANGYCSVPASGRVDPIRRHKECFIVAAANTFGLGANRMYVGRNQLDAATLNRFTMGTIEIDYDRDLERNLVTAYLPGDSKAEELLSWGWKVRDAINATGLRRIMSTRNLEDAAKMLASGIEFSEVVEAFFEGWTADEKSRVQLHR